MSRCSETRGSSHRPLAECWTLCSDRGSYMCNPSYLVLFVSIERSTGASMSTARALEGKGGGRVGAIGSGEGGTVGHGMVRNSG